MSFGVPHLFIPAAMMLSVLLPVQGTAQTLEHALVQAYRNNETLNAERAALRATDEDVPEALSGYRPRVNATVDVGRRRLNETGATGEQQKATTTPRGVELTATQSLFDGFQTPNRVRMAESQVLAAREALRVMEQSVLLDAVTAYMDVLRNGAVVELQRRNLELLREQYELTRSRAEAGQVTTTDVALAQSRLAAARSDLLAAQAANNTSRASFERVIGDEPGKLMPGRPVDRLSPPTLDVAIAVARAQHPAVIAAMHGADIALLQSKIAEGALYPKLTLEGTIKRRYDNMTDQDVSFPAKTTDASIISRVVVPIYQGGGEYSNIRRSKETVSQRRLSLEALRKLARATVIQTWNSLNAAKAQIESVESQVKAAEAAFEGMRREFETGQRNIFELLTTQQELRNARVALITAQRERVVASYTLLAAVGRLSPQVLSLPTEMYDPAVHYHEVRDSWFGVRTPDGR